MIGPAALALAAALTGGASMDSGLVISVANASKFPGDDGILGKGKGISWGTLPPAQAIALAKDAPSKAHLVWLSRDAYQADIAGLGKPDIAAAVAHRAGLPGEVLSDLAESLAAEAARLAARSGDPRSPLYSVFLEGYSLGRMAGTPAEEAIRALEDRALLDALGREQGGTHAVEAGEAAISERTRQALARASSALGRPGLETASPVFRRTRAYFLPGRKSLLQESLRRGEIPSVKMREGRLALLDSTQAQSIREADKPVPVFLTAARYAKCVRLETPARLQAHVAAIVANGGPDAAAFREAHEETRLDLLVRISGILSSAKALPKEDRNALQGSLREELGRLDAPPSEPGALLTARLETLSAYASAAGEKDIADWASKCAEAIKRQVRAP